MRKTEANKNNHHFEEVELTEGLSLLVGFELSCFGNVVVLVRIVANVATAVAEMLVWIWI